MSEYRVKWEIDVEADTPEGAARLAREYQRDPDAIVGVFDVYSKNRRENCRIDLDHLDGKQVE